MELTIVSKSSGRRVLRSITCVIAGQFSKQYFIQSIKRIIYIYIYLYMYISTRLTYETTKVYLSIYSLFLKLSCSFKNSPNHSRKTDYSNIRAFSCDLYWLIELSHTHTHKHTHTHTHTHIYTHTHRCNLSLSYRHKEIFVMDRRSNIKGVVI